MLRHDGVALEDMSDGMSQGFGFTVWVRRGRFERCGRAKLTEHLQFVRVQLRQLTLAHSIVSFFYNTVLIALAVNVVVVLA